MIFRKEGYQPCSAAAAIPGQKISVSYSEQKKRNYIYVKDS